jgi:hypothetical protein
MNSHWDWFSIYEKYDGDMVYFGDEYPLNIVGHGGFLIRFPNGRVKGIGGALHISSLVHNILSTSKLNDAVCRLFYLTKGVIWLEELWCFLRVFTQALCSSLMCALFNARVLQFM